MKIVFNPFIKYTEKQLLPLAIIITIAGCFIAHYCNTRYDGILDLHFGNNVSKLAPFKDNGINILVLFFLLYTAGKYINGKTRAVDIFVTVVTARLPLYVLPVININNQMQEISLKVIDSNSQHAEISTLETLFIITTTIIIILFVIWYIVVLYNGFKVSANAKGIKHNILFIIAIILAEAASKITIAAIN